MASLDRNSWAENDKLEALSNCMKIFGVQDIKDSPLNSNNATPIFDALQLMGMEEKKNA